MKKYAHGSIVIIKILLKLIYAHILKTCTKELRDDYYLKSLTYCMASQN